ncbi:hypothetical protein [Nostoc sp. CHAB 5715]|uniref:hypothetical protein n=1 Tax=Nostoc sp. CHAB 5715 TaxID=2780400 RepID=UPI001E4D07F4|nr:hypothetical protein [Nostoc sp. CHAB 5715]MCC5624795.1 hypothetical protein [Nostoc sp. CHAB 5715]
MRFKSSSLGFGTENVYAMSTTGYAYALSYILTDIKTFEKHKKLFPHYFGLPRQRLAQVAVPERSRSRSLS